MSDLSTLLWARDQNVYIVFGLALLVFLTWLGTRNRPALRVMLGSLALFMTGVLLLFGIGEL